MMKGILMYSTPLKPIFITVWISIMIWACDDEDSLDTDFNIPRTETFASLLSEYALFEEPMNKLSPSSDLHLYELNSKLFTDYAKKQRLFKLPPDQKVTFNEGKPNFPDGTLLAKTFYFDVDLRDPNQGRKIVETRLFIKTEGMWNVATYVWNQDQSDAELVLGGTRVDVSWIDEAGETRSTQHEVPSEVACVTCHQDQDQVSTIGPQLRNLNRNIDRAERPINQLEFFQGLNLIDLQDDLNREENILVNYSDSTQALAQRARAYLEVNCAHCHQPTAWDRSARQGLDFRYETPLSESGILSNIQRIRNQLLEGEMPYIGTTLIHTEGVNLVVEYLDSL